MLVTLFVVQHTGADLKVLRNLDSQLAADVCNLLQMLEEAAPAGAMFVAAEAGSGKLLECWPDTRGAMLRMAELIVDLSFEPGDQKQN